MEGKEMQMFMAVWLTVIACLCYCYTVTKHIPKGIRRLFSILPVVFIFFLLPLNLKSVHLGGNTAFFISWLASSKLLLFAFDKGPLCSNPPLTLFQFLAVSCLPIKIIHKNNQHPSHEIDLDLQINGDPSSKIPKKGWTSHLNYAVKFLLLAMVVRVYDYTDKLHPMVILILYCLHVYFFMEIMLAMVAAMARVLLGVELEPQFDEPYLSTSLQDFWGRRWNIMVTSILRPTVYEPVLQLCTRPMGRKQAQLIGVFLSFLVSAIMHELMFYYLGRAWPTGEVTLFFVLHGVCLMVEIVVKKKLKGKFRLPRSISRFLTVGFVMLTGYLLFFPQLVRHKIDQRAIEEYAIVGAILKNYCRTLKLI